MMDYRTYQSGVCVSPVRITFKSIGTFDQEGDDMIKQFMQYPNVVMNFAELQKQRESAGQIKSAEQTIKNAKSALKLWLIFNNKDEVGDNSRIGTEFRSQFDKKIVEFQKFLKKTQSASVAANNVSLIRALRNSYELARQVKEGKIDVTLGDTLRLYLSKLGLSAAEAALQCGVPRKSFLRILNNCPLHVTSGVSNIAKIESFLIENKIIENFGELRRMAVFETHDKSRAQRIKPSEKIRLIPPSTPLPDNKKLKHANINNIHPDIAFVIKDLIKEKTISCKWIYSENFQRKKCITSVEIDGRLMYLPSASNTMKQIFRFIQFVADSQGLSSEEVDIPAIVDYNLHGDLYEFLAKRRGGKLGGAGKLHRSAFSNFFKCLVASKKFKELEQSTQLKVKEQIELFNGLSITNKTGSSTHDYAKTLEHLGAQVNDLALPFYEIVKNALAEAKRMPENYDRAYLLRSACILAILIINPLRARNIAIMSYCEDGSGWFRCKSLTDNDRGYSISVPAPYTKNKRDIKFEILGEFVELFDIYLNEARPLLLGDDETQKNLFFVSDKTEKRSKSTAELETTIDPSPLLKRFLAGKIEGYAPGAHFFRHLAATRLLLANPGAWEDAANLLDDSIKTVMLAYAHLASKPSKVLYQASIHALGNCREIAHPAASRPSLAA